MILKQLGIKFMLRDGHFLAMILPETEVRQIVQNWQAETYKLLGKAFIGGTTAEGVWALRIEDVVGMHSFDPSQVQSSQAVPGFSQSTSGLKTFE